MPWCDTHAMQAHLIEISAAVDPGAHAVVIVDQAGWHMSPKLNIPDNIGLTALAPGRLITILVADVGDGVHYRKRTLSGFIEWRRSVANVGFGMTMGSARLSRRFQRKAAEGMQFPWRWNGDTISLNLVVIWKVSG